MEPTPQYDESLFKKCVDFHGHLCPGLVLGFQASMVAMDWLSARRSEDEEVVAIAETDACGCDAIQVITGCTFGKGNFLHRDYGKTAFTFFSRASGKGIRIAQKPQDEDALTPEHRGLLDKIRLGTATKIERERFKKLHNRAAFALLGTAPEELFTIEEVTEPLPEKAVIKPSVTCSQCGEPTMSSKLTSIAGQMVCKACLPLHS